MDLVDDKGSPSSPLDSSVENYPLLKKLVQLTSSLETNEEVSLSLETEALDTARPSLGVTLESTAKASFITLWHDGRVHVLDIEASGESRDSFFNIDPDISSQDFRDFFKDRGVGLSHDASSHGSAVQDQAFEDLSFDLLDRVSGPIITIVPGDITHFSGDAIINAANSALSGGGGVDWAIHRAGGPRLLEAARRYGTCPVGEVRVTPGFELEASFVIHAVPPVWEGGHKGEIDLLKKCCANIVNEAKSQGFKSLAIPALSAGANRFPPDVAAQTLIEGLSECLNEDDRIIISLVLPDNKLRRAFMRALRKKLKNSEGDGVVTFCSGSELGK